MLTQFTGADRSWESYSCHSQVLILRPEGNRPTRTCLLPWPAARASIRPSRRSLAIGRVCLSTFQALQVHAMSALRAVSVSCSSATMRLAITPATDPAAQYSTHPHPHPPANTITMSPYKATHSSLAHPPRIQNARCQNDQHQCQAQYPVHHVVSAHSLKELTEAMTTPPSPSRAMAPASTTPPTWTV
jgi:hypothetical protein